MINQLIAVTSYRYINLIIEPSFPQPACRRQARLLTSGMTKIKKGTLLTDSISPICIFRSVWYQPWISC